MHLPPLRLAQLPDLWFLVCTAAMPVSVCKAGDARNRDTVQL